MADIYSNMFVTIVSAGKGETRTIETKIISIKNIKSPPTIKGAVHSRIYDKTKKTKVHHNGKSTKVKLSTKRKALVWHTRSWVITFRHSSIVLVRGWTTTRYTRCSVVMLFEGKHSFVSKDSF
jgi:hypothetical protein